MQVEIPLTSLMHVDGECGRGWYIDISDSVIIESQVHSEQVICKFDQKPAVANISATVLLNPALHDQGQPFFAVSILTS